MSGGIRPLHVEAAARHDVHARLRRDPLQEIHIAPDIVGSGIDDAADALGEGGVELFEHGIDVLRGAGQIAARVWSSNPRPFP